MKLSNVIFRVDRSVQVYQEYYFMVAEQTYHDSEEAVQCRFLG